MLKSGRMNLLLGEFVKIIVYGVYFRVLQVLVMEVIGVVLVLVSIIAIFFTVIVTHD